MKQLKFPFVIIVFWFCNYGEADEGTWSYSGETGPSHWGGHCKGLKQSPINIEESNTDVDKQLANLDLSEYANIAAMDLTIRNNGHTVQVDIPKEIRISGGGLPEKYIAAQFHFHWGGTDDEGAEHQINGDTFPLEFARWTHLDQLPFVFHSQMHLVHYAESQGSVANAMDKKNGLAVLGILFKVGAANQHLQKIIENFGLAASKGMDGVINAVDIGSVLHAVQNKYFRYQGSLTTPACYESVLWSVFQTPVELSHQQISAFRDIIKSSVAGAKPEVKMQDNYRPVQSLNGRRVYRSSDVVIGTGNGGGGGGAVSPSMGSGLLCVTFLTFHILCRYMS